MPTASKNLLLSSFHSSIRISYLYTLFGLLPYYQSPLPDNIQDPGETFMERFIEPNGATHFPYQVDNHNLYTAVTGNFSKAIMQCHVDITRKTGDEYSSTYYDPANDEIGTSSSGLHNYGDRLLLSFAQGAIQYTSLAVIHTGKIGRTGTRGSRIDFESVTAPWVIAIRLRISGLIRKAPG
jgi:hypothetical protein